MHNRPKLVRSLSLSLSSASLSDRIPPCHLFINTGNLGTDSRRLEGGVGVARVRDTKGERGWRIAAVSCESRGPRVRREGRAMLSRGHNSSGAYYPTLPLSKSRNTVGLTFRPGEEPLLHYAATAPLASWRRSKGGNCAAEMAGLDKILFSSDGQ